MVSSHLVFRRVDFMLKTMGHLATARDDFEFTITSLGAAQ
jgi:hypothetical protein